MATINVDGREYQLPDMDDLTLGELELAEDLGADLSSGRRSVKEIRALIVIVKDRAGEVYDRDALKELKLSQIKVEGDADPPPNRAQRRKSGASANPDGSSGGQS